jgi:hypothetical protein
VDAHFIAFSGSSMLYWVPSVETYDGSVFNGSGLASEASAAAPIKRARWAPAWRRVCAGRSAEEKRIRHKRRRTPEVYIDTRSESKEELFLSADVLN